VTEALRGSASGLPESLLRLLESGRLSPLTSQLAASGLVVRHEEGGVL
jgi:hypothetical protein